MQDMKEKREAPHEKAEFKGYSLEELKYQRAISLLKREHSKERFFKYGDDLKKKLPLAGSNGKLPATASLSKGVVGKIFSSLNYLDYAVLGLSVFSTGRKILSLVRKFHKK